MYKSCSCNAEGRVLNLVHDAGACGTIQLCAAQRCICAGRFTGRVPWNGLLSILQNAGSVDRNSSSILIARWHTKAYPLEQTLIHNMVSSGTAVSGSCKKNDGCVLASVHIHTFISAFKSGLCKQCDLVVCGRFPNPTYRIARVITWPGCRSQASASPACPRCRCT